MENICLPTRPSVLVHLIPTEWGIKKIPIEASFSENRDTGVITINLENCESGNIDTKDLLSQLKELGVIDSAEAWRVMSIDDNTGDTTTIFDVYTCVKIKKK